MPRARQSRAALLAAAERLFADRGLAGARTEEIAAAAGVNKALLHYYFDTKEKLHRAVLANLFEQFLASVREPLEDTASPRAALLRYVDRHFDFLAQHPNYPRLLQRAMMSGDPHLRGLLQRYLRPVYLGLSRILRAGIRRRECRPVDVDNMVVSLIAVTVFYFAASPVVNLILEWNPYDQRRVAARKRAVLDFVRHGLLRSPG